jgi:hypothetical protein
MAFLVEVSGHKIVKLSLLRREFCQWGISNESLDWQNSQFTNIVGKDDESAAIEVN